MNPGSQTLLRGLDLIEAVARESVGYADLAKQVGLTGSTTHRLASALVERGYLSFTPRSGYRLGHKLLELGLLAQSEEQTNLMSVAHGHLEELARQSKDTVRLSVIEHDFVLYLQVIPGRRSIKVAGRAGERQQLTSTSAGKALLLDESEDQWRAILDAELAAGRPSVDASDWIERMRAAVRAGFTYGLGENEDNIRGVAAPIRDRAGRIVAAVSISSPAHQMDDDRMSVLSVEVRATAASISRDLGYLAPQAG